MQDKNSSQEIQQHPDKGSSDIPLSINEPSSPPADTVGNNTKENDIESLEDRIRAAEKWMIFLTAAIIVVTFFGVIAAYMQWNTMSGQLDEMREAGKQTDILIQEVTEQAKAANRLADSARDSILEGRSQFQQDQRPYIIYTVVPTDLVPNAPIQVNLLLVNYGKSPAIKVRGTGNVFWGKDAMKQADEWFDAQAIKSLPSNVGTIIPPGVIVNPQRITLTSASSISQSEFKVLTSTNFSIVVVTHHEYEDRSGNHYWTNSCYSRLANGAISNCFEHNEIH